jgi:DNA-binding transcriptional ArsR family regulator
MQIFAALADPTRTKIIEVLARTDLSAGEIAARFPVSRPAVSRHLSVLRKARLVHARGEAQRRVYSLDPAALDEVDQWVARCRQVWSSRLDALGRHLDAMATNPLGWKNQPTKGPPRGLRK